MSKEKKSWAVAILLHKQSVCGVITCLMLSVHPGNKDEAIGYAVTGVKEAKPGFAIMDIVTQNVFE